jgi:LPS export ABC transporter permease LptG
MSVLFRWLFFSTLMRIAAIAVAVTLIFMIGESIDKARYLGNGLTVMLLLEYLLLKSPYMISELMPVVVLIGASISVLELSLKHELAALQAAGITFISVLKPLLAAGAVFGFFMFAVGEWVEPVVNHRLQEIERVYIHKDKPLQQGVQWLHEKDTFMRLTPLTKGYFSMLLVKRDAQGLWAERMDANKAIYKQGQWELEHVSLSKPKGSGFTTQFYSNLQIPSKLSPQTVAAPDPRDMSWLELYNFEKALADAGLESKSYLYRLQHKIAAPISCLIMVILAYSFCASMGERIAAKSMGLILSITTGILHYVVSSAIEVLATGEQLPVIYAVWLPNILFLGIVGFLLLRKEGY